MRRKKGQSNGSLTYLGFSDCDSHRQWGVKWFHFEWLCGLGYSHAGREMMTVKCGVRDRVYTEHGVHMWPNNQHSKWVMRSSRPHSDPCQACRAPDPLPPSHCVCLPLYREARLQSSGRGNRDLFILLISNIALYYVQLSNGCRF